MKALKIVSTLSFILTVGHLYSQGLEIELLGGPTLTSLRGNDAIEDNLDPAINFSTGLGINYLFKKNSILNFTVLYDKKGGGNEYTIVFQPVKNVKAKYRSNFEYITVPIQWGKRFGQKIKYQFEIGIYSSFLLKQEEITKSVDEHLNSSEEYTYAYKKIDFGLAASFNIFIPIKDSFSVKVGIDDNLGLINTSDVPVMDNGTIKHNSLGISLGLNLKVN